MEREQFIQYITEEYGIEGECLWPRYPRYRAFRHAGNRKWFALVMDVPQNRLGLQGTEILDVVNLKCDPVLIGSLRKEPGFFPAYHMSKTNWITAALDGSVPEEQLKKLLAMSYDATAPRMKGAAR